MDIMGKCGVSLWISWVNVEHYSGTAQHHDDRILIVYTLKKYSTERFVGFYNNSIREEGGGGGGAIAIIGAGCW